MTLKEKIQQLCVERDISVRQLEKMAGLSVRTIQHWDESTPSGDKMYKVAKALNVPIEELFTVFDPSFQRIADIEKEKMSVDEISALTEEEKSILFLFRILNKDGQDRALEYINMLCDTEKFKRYTEDMYSEVVS